MLAYFHTSLIPFTALPSDYLVACQVALADHDSDGGESFDFEEPEIWFSDASDELEGQNDWHGIQPCSPHAMFRLADCYEITELRELSKSRILRSLTVENVRFFLTLPSSSAFVDAYHALQVAYEVAPSLTHTTLCRSLTNCSVPCRSITTRFKKLFSNTSTITG